jgi:Peptidase family M28
VRTRHLMVVVVFAALAALAFQMAPQRAPFNDSINQDAMRADLFFLAGDGFKGRLTNTPENSLAAEFIKSRFERMGLKPANNGSFFQPYNLVTATLGADNSLQVINGENERMQLRSGQDYYPQSFSASAHVRGSVVFAGFGITAPDLGYDDYKGPDIRGKIVLVVDHEPGESDPSSPFDGVVTSDAAGALRKALAAQEKGAIGILFVSDVHNHTQPSNFEASARNAWPAETPRIRRFTLESWVDRVHIPAAQISPALGAVLVRGTNKSLADLSKSSETRTGITPVPLPGTQVELVASVERHVVPDRNVVGMIEGSDPLMKNEYIIICAHIDHEGVNNGQVMNGADDNGSGSIGLLNIAEAYALAAKAGQGPKRTVLFADWNSEERGLLGAWAYTENPLFPLDKTVAVLNMDMIGRNEEVQVGGGGRFRGLEIQTAESNNNATNIIGTLRSPDLKAAVEKANGGIGLELKFRYDNNISNLMRRSDHWPFIQRGVPGLWFHTGLHPDYHTPNDRPEKINYVKMEKVARLVHQMSWNLAQQEDRPKLMPRSKAQN